jgi:hypothetical protein
VRRFPRLKNVYGDSYVPRTPERSIEEASLTELARAGDRDAFGQLYIRCADYVRGYVDAGA